MKLNQKIKEKVAELAKERFINKVVERIISKTFKDSEERVNHYIAKEAARLGEQITKDLPL